MNCPSYPSIFSISHKASKPLFDGKTEVLVEEKVDGSQFTFGIRDGELRMRSKGAEVHEHAPEALFSKAVTAVQSLKPLLKEGWLYRGEYLRAPKHSTLVYNRTPNNHIMIFDIETDAGEHLNPEAKKQEAARLGLETVPMFYAGVLTSPDALRQYLDTESVLGGQKIEGVVVKPAAYDVYGKDKKVLLAKFVSEAFKEVHQAVWTKDNKPAGGRDVTTAIGSQYCTAARWQKAVMRLKEQGVLVGTHGDIGLLIKSVIQDIQKEEEEAIKQKLFDWAWPQIRRMATAGLPEWYKEELIKEVHKP